MPATLVYSSRRNKSERSCSVYFNDRTTYISASRLIDAILRATSKKKVVFETDRFVCFSKDGAKVIRLRHHK